MKTQKIYNLIILDASGSMSSIYGQALTGVNETIATIRMAQQQYPDMPQYLSLASFSAGEHFLNRIYNAAPIAAVRNITPEDYPLLGCTALYDAIGTTVSELQRCVTHDDRVLVTIITDGYENASHTWRGSQIKSLIEELRQMGWTFTYIGADQDVEKEAGNIGVRNSLRFSSDPRSTQRMFARESRSRKAYYASLNRACSMGAAPMQECADYFREEGPAADETDDNKTVGTSSSSEVETKVPGLLKRLFGKV